MCQCAIYCILLCHSNGNSRTHMSAKLIDKWQRYNKPFVKNTLSGHIILKSVLFFTIKTKNDQFLKRTFKNKSHLNVLVFFGVTLKLKERNMN